MRIVAGEFRSRVIKAVCGDSTRPTSDKIKEAIFSRLGPYFEGGMMLDLFGGSGNIGLEAISRGMQEVYVCDAHPKAIETIKDNVQSLGVGNRCHIKKCDYHAMLEMCHTQGVSFDLIFLDPPYKKQQIGEILSYIDHHGLLHKDGNIVCESLKDDDFEETYGELHKVKDVTYGITRITYYTR